MAKITFEGICSGTEEKVSTKGNKYKITKFVEIPSLDGFEVFGDLGLVAHQDARHYELTAKIVSLGNVSAVPVASSKKS